MDQESYRKAEIRSGKKSRRKKNIRLGARILSVLLAAVLILNTAVFAYADEPELPKISSWPVPLSENSERIVSENPLKAKAIGKNDPQGTRLKKRPIPLPGCMISVSPDVLQWIRLTANIIGMTCITAISSDRLPLCTWENCTTGKRQEKPLY